MMRTGITSAVIVAHGGVMMTILAAYGLPRANFYDWLTGNGRATPAGFSEFMDVRPRGRGL